jgi:hypothetical protein
MAMKNTQGWGWLTAGVLALGLNGIYHDGGAAWAHRIAKQVVQQSEALVELASVQGDFREGTNMVAGRNRTASCRFAAAMARVQTEIARAPNGMARFEATSARQEEASARMEANRARMEAQVARVRLAPVAFHSITSPVEACPRVRVNMNVPRVQVPVMRIPAPVVDVEMGAGPI